MPGTVQDLTNTLLTSIDSEGNVKDMTVLLTVINELEKIEITAEDLKVTRLGKFVNLIRRKLADVDKKLSKRLKKLVKQWLQLVPPSRLHNGVLPTAPPAANSLLSTTPTLGKPAGKGEKGISVEMELPPVQAVPSPNSTHSNNVHAPPSRTQVVSPHPSSLTRSFSPSIPANSSQHSKISTSSSCESYGSTTHGSLEVDVSQEVHHSHFIGSHLPVLRPSTSPTPPASPTPPYSTLSSRPSQPVSVNPTKNRSKVLHMLSGLKKNSSPSKDPTLTINSSPSKTTPTDARQAVLSLNKSPSNSSSTSNSSSKLSHQSSVLHPSSPLFSAAIDIVVDTSGEVSPSAPWISGEAEFDYGPDFSALSEGTGRDAVEAATLNGNGSRSHLDVLKGSRKRERSDSPLSKSSTSPPKHKRRKRHKQNTAGKKSRHFEELVVRLPLNKVASRDLQRTKSPSSRENHHVEEVSSLIVSVSLSALRTLPRAVHPTTLATAESWDSQSRASSTASLQHSPADHPLHQQQQQHHHQQHHQPPSNTKQHTLDTTSPDSETKTETAVGSRHEAHQSPTPVVAVEEVPDGGEPEQRIMPCDLPPGARPGVDGCIGNDGNWYDWTDHIQGYGPDVTVLPYVYID